MNCKKKYAELKYLGLALIAMPGNAVAVALGTPWPLKLRSQTTRLTQVGYDIGIVAAPLCRLKAVGTGIALDYLEAYERKDRSAVAILLKMTDAPQIAAVAKGSPAQAAGINSGDDLLTVNGVTTDRLRSASPDQSLFADELEQQIGALPLKTPIKFGLKRAGRIFEVELTPVAVCSARFVIKTKSEVSAFSDGVNVALTSKLIEGTLNDDELALIAAHETSHVINRDGKRTSLAEQRRVENRADALGVALARCAGYNPELGLQFWLRHDSSDKLHRLRAHTHPSNASRAALMRQQAASTSCPPDTRPPVAAMPDEALSNADRPSAYQPQKPRTTEPSYA